MVRKAIWEGVVGGARSKVYFHNIKIVVATEVLEIKAGFSRDLTENLLGQIGFFDNFVVTFDPSPHPPCFELRRARRNWCIAGLELYCASIGISPRGNVRAFHRRWEFRVWRA